MELEDGIKLRTKVYFIAILNIFCVNCCQITREPESVNNINSEVNVHWKEFCYPIIGNGLRFCDGVNKTNLIPIFGILAGHHGLFWALFPENIQWCTKCSHPAKTEPTERVNTHRTG